VSFSSEDRIDHKSVADVAPNWAWYKYRTFDVCENLGIYEVLWGCSGLEFELSVGDMMARHGRGENVT